MTTSKPDLTRVWANTAPPANVVDPDVTTPGKVSAGWQAEVPPFEHFNFLQKWFTQGLAHFNEQGIGVWDTDTTYPVNGIAKGSNGVIYLSIVEQSGNDPVSDDGTNWKQLLVKTPYMFGAKGDGVTDDTAALQAMFDEGGDIVLPEGNYLYSYLNITQPFNMIGDGILRYDSSVSPSGNSSIVISSSFNADKLQISTEGSADLAYDLLQASSDDIYIGLYSLQSDNQRSQTGGSDFYGSRITIDKVQSKNVARPLAIVPESGTTVRTDVNIGDVYVRNYIRAVKFSWCNDWSLRSADLRERWLGVTTMTPGYNGMLLEANNNFSVGDCTIYNAPEHSVRIGGAADSTNFSFGKIFTKDGAGSAFKSNVNTGFHAINGRVESITAVNNGEGDLGGNREVVRLTKVKQMSIGSISAYEYCTRALVLADIEGLIVGEIYGENVQARLVQTDDGQDASDSDINGVYIGECTALMNAGARAAFGLVYSAVGRTLSNFIIAKSFITNYTNFGAITTGTNISGLVYIAMRCKDSDPNPAVEDPVATDFLIIDAQKALVGYQGRADNQDFASNIATVGDNFDPSGSPVKKSNIFLRSLGLSGLDAYGGSLAFSRVGSGRRGAAISLKQTTSDNKQNGLAFFVQSTGTAATEQVIERMVLKHNGVLNLNNLPTSSAGLSSGDLWNNGGVVNIVP